MVYLVAFFADCSNSIILVTVPLPTVRAPSRIKNSIPTVTLPKCSCGLRKPKYALTVSPGSATSTSGYI